MVDDAIRYSSFFWLLKRLVFRDSKIINIIINIFIISNIIIFNIIIRGVKYCI